MKYSGSWICNGTVSDYVVEDDDNVRWLRFFSSRAASVILTHYIIAVDLTAVPNMRFSAVPDACSWPLRGGQKCL